MQRRSQAETGRKVQRGCALGCAILFLVLLMVILSGALLGLFGSDEEYSQRDREAGVHCLNAAGHSSGVTTLLRYGLELDGVETISTEISEVDEEGNHAVLTTFTADGPSGPEPHVFYGVLDTETCTASLIGID